MEEGSHAPLQVSQSFEAGSTAVATRVPWSSPHPLPLLLLQLSSSYAGYGTSSLDNDAEELLVLGRRLCAERGSTGLALVGHSTGCQIIARYMQKFADRGGSSEKGSGALPVILGTVLQAPVR